jgi:hypothetical protein
VFVAVSVHFENNGVAVAMLLDIVEVAMSHSGINLAGAFAKVLEDFGISDKVRRYLLRKRKKENINTITDPQYDLR